MSITQLVHQYGYIAVATGVGAESVGLPIPGETALIAAATYAGSTHHLNPAALVAVAAVAAIVGDNLGFGVARWRGPQILRWVCARSTRLSRAVTVGCDEFDQHRTGVVVGGRFVSVVRTYTAFLAGSSSMRWSRFAWLNAFASILWAAIIGFGAAALGSTFGLLAGYGTMAAAVLAVAVLALIRRRRREPPTRRDEQVTSRTPGPEAARDAGAPAELTAAR
ncbi:MAG: VTT domain-containing protein [Actinomycetota bacterium]|nr:VTT domain-containing protein [Actinomycetota bacterium]